MHFMHLSRREALVLPTAAAMAYSSTVHAQTRPVVVGQTFIAESLDPAQGAAGWALQSHGVVETLFTVDRSGRTAPNLARSVTRDGEAWRIELAPGLKFSDGAEVTAPAVRDALMRSIAANPRAAAQTGPVAIDVLGPLVLGLRTQRAVAAMDAVLAEFPLAIYRADGDRFHGTGPFRVTEFRRGDLLRLEPNPHYRSPSARPAVVIRRISDPQALALGLESGELDLAFNLASETLPRLRRRDGVTVKSTPVAYQYMLLANTARAPLDDARVRRAIDLALDRAVLAQVLGAGEPATGMFPSFMPFAMPDSRRTDLAAANRLLDEAGWARGGAGVRLKDGRALDLTLTAYPQRPDFVTLLPVVKAQLEAIGFRLRTESREAITPFLQQKQFDLSFWAMHTAPGGDGGFVFEQYLRSTAPLNFMSYASPRLDAILDRLRERDEPAARAALLREAHAPLLEDAPIVFLITPHWHVGLSRRLADYQPFPSDYYIVRADLTARS
jgi:peptide/nickel transport system substrate-binding protein